MKTSHLWRSVFAVLAVALTAVIGLPPASALQAQQGLQGGWAIDDFGHVNFPHSVMSELPYIQQAGAGVLRLNFRLGACFSTWTKAGCTTADGPTALAVYDQVINAAIDTYHLRVVGLLSNEAWPGTQSNWTARNAENAGGTGDNSYIQGFARNAAGVLAQHYASKITTWEVWNEPNAWTSNPQPGIYTGGSFIYPSNFAWLLKRSYSAVKTYQPGTASVVISGGLFGHDPSGAATVLSSPSGSRTTVVKRGTFGNPSVTRSATPTAPAITCGSSVPSGADYLCNTYAIGQQKASWGAGAYPLDGIGQHLYIDQGGTTSSAKITTYVGDVRNAYIAFESATTPKKIEITEFGWVAEPSSPDYTTAAAYQAQNVQTAYTTFRGISYVSRADYFAAQDVPEGLVFYGLVQGDGQTFKPAFGAYQTYAAF
jgi:hypothetical protein